MLFLLHSCIDWSFSWYLCIHTCSTSSLKSILSGRHEKSQTGSIFTCDLMPKLILTFAEIWKIRFIYSLRAEQAARELQKLSHYLFAKITVVTLRVCLVSQGHAVKKVEAGHPDLVDSVWVTWKVQPCQMNDLTRNEFSLSVLHKNQKMNSAQRIQCFVPSSKFSSRWRTEMPDWHDQLLLLSDVSDVSNMTNNRKLCPNNGTLAARFGDLFGCKQSCKQREIRYT